MSEQTLEEPPIPTFEATEGAEQSLGDYLDEWLRRVRSGDLGSLPIIIGLIVITIVFGILEPLFFSSRNFVNLLLQMAGITTMAIGIVFVLLIAEIDLSVAFVSAIGGVSTALLLREPLPGLPWYVALGIALLATALIGLIQGLIITKAGVPSFVVTLAGLLIWSGVILMMTTVWSTAGTIVIQDPIILGMANSYLPPLWSWVMVGIIVAGYAIGQFTQRQTLRRQNLAAKPLTMVILQIAALALITGGAVWYANQDRGVPTVTVIILVLILFWTFIAERTRFGRYVYAVGGNPEAARRAGINVDRIRIVVFMICSFMAGVGGVILASRLRSVDTNAGQGNLLLNAIAAAVIGGTSLFGGSGRVMSALLGALIIASVENGMGLLGLPSGIKFVVTGLVLLAAVLIDAFSRRSRQSSGIA
jgi:D-xylose transport system permease protein